MQSPDLSSEQVKRDRGRRFAKARRAAGLSADDFIRKLAIATRGRLRVTTSAVYSWEKGRNFLRDDIAFEAAEVLGCRPEELIGPAALLDMPLGESSRSATRSAPAAPRAAPKEQIVELTIRPADGIGPTRHRQWTLRYDETKQQFIVRGAPGTTPDSLRFLTPEGTPLEAKPDFFDLTALRYAFPATSFPQEDDEPLLIPQLTPNAAAILTGELRPGGRSFAETQTHSALRIVKDIELELADFVGEKAAGALVAMWEESERDAEHLTSYLAHHLASGSVPAFERMLHATLVHLSLLKNYEKAFSTVEELLKLADDPWKVAQAKYLAGRCSWYLGKEHKTGKSLFPKAIAELVRARQLTVDEHLESAAVSRSHRELLTAQCSIYLGRILNADATLDRLVREGTGLSFDELMDEARIIGLRNQRPDVGLLAQRVIFERLMGDTRGDSDSIEFGKELLADIAAAEQHGFDLRNIEDNTVIMLGIALRRRGNEADRVEAEKHYRRLMDRGRNDSTAGIAAYLTGDLFVDRSQQAAAAALAIRGAESPTNNADRDERPTVDVEKLIQEARKHHREAKKLYDRSRVLLKNRGDRKAIAKMEYRRLWVRQVALPDPATRSVVLESHATREFEFDSLFIGKSCGKPAEHVSRPTLIKLFSALHLSPETASESRPPVSLDRYVDESSLLLVSRVFGAALSIQLLRQIPGNGDRFDICGWYVSPNYRQKFRERLNSVPKEGLAATDRRRFEDLLWDLWWQIGDDLIAIRDFDRADFDRLVVHTPHDPALGFLPFEAMELSSVHPNLATTARRGVVQAGLWAAPLDSAEVALGADDFVIYASDDPRPEPASGRLGPSLYEAVGRETKFRVEPLPFETHEDRAVVFDSRGVIILAHDDHAGELRNRLRTWKFDGTQAVVLAFCGSGRTEVHGPFSQGAALRVREALGERAVTVASRLPVTVGEALRLVQHLGERLDGQRSVAEVVNDYVRDMLDQNENPFLVSWIVL
ncbi:MAG: helix-turn-helix transcriptional regulator [Planctomycetaceae bacterium]|nr:helix-turn-helix transcriptional regulator [Planctomycetaceae bacterium]